MNYHEIKIETNKVGLEILPALLLDLGIEETILDGNTVAKEVLERKNSYSWDYVNEEAFNPSGFYVSFYLEDNDEYSSRLEEINLLLKSYQDKGFGSLNLMSKEVEDEDWLNSYKLHFKAQDLTENLRVQPTWEDEYTGNKEVIYLDPGMAFGTGAHETTSLCLKLLDEIGCKNKDVLDVGTGSGILAIAASKLGAKQVLGVDIDTTAVDVSRENVKVNKVSHNVEIKEGDLTKGIDFNADIVLGNLMAEIVVLLSESLSNHIKQGGYFISSGILVEKENMVINTLESQGFRIEKVLEDGDWCAILGRS